LTSEQGTCGAETTEVSGFSGGLAEGYVLLGYNGPSQGNQFLTFQGHTVVFKTSSREVM